MGGHKKPWKISLLRSDQGGVALEMALLLPVLLLVVFGLVDFGHAWYMKHELTTASREGARYATRYQTNAGGNHILPNTLNPSVSNWVSSQYQSLLPADANLTVTPSGPGYTSGLAGDDITVTTTARKNWFVVGRLVPGLGNYLDITVSTVMKCE